MLQGRIVVRQRQLAIAAVAATFGLLWGISALAAHWADVQSTISPLFLQPQAIPLDMSYAGTPSLVNDNSEREAIVAFYSPPEGPVDSDNSFWDVLLTFIYQVKIDPLTRTDKDMVVIVTPDTEPWRREALERLGMVLFEGTNPQSPMTPSVDRWRTVLTKIHVFDLPYKRVVYMDTDMLLLQSLDVILESPITNEIITCDRDSEGQVTGPMLAATAELGCCDQAPFPFNETAWRYRYAPLNSGLMVVCPDHDTFKGLEALAHRGPRGDPGGGDQVLFNDYFALDGPHPHAKLPVEFSLTHGDKAGWIALEQGKENSVALHGKWWQDLNEEGELRMQRALWYRRGRMEGMFDWLQWEGMDGRGTKFRT